MIGFDTEDSGCCAEDGSVGEETGRSVIGGDAYVLEYKGSDEEGLWAEEGVEGRRGGDAGCDGKRCEEGEVDVGAGNRSSTVAGDGLLDEADVVDFVLCDLVGILGEARGPPRGLPRYCRGRWWCLRLFPHPLRRRPCLWLHRE